MKRNKKNSKKDLQNQKFCDIVTNVDYGTERSNDPPAVIQNNRWFKPRKDGGI